MLLKCIHIYTFVIGPFSKRPRIEKSQNINAKKVKSACDAQQDKKPTRTEILRKQGLSL